MQSNLNYTTVTPLLLSVLKDLMLAKEFEAFRLVGGTALSLYKGHRISVDIDLFTDAKYGTINFDAIDNFLSSNYPYVDKSKNDIIGFGKSYFVGESEDNVVKIDVFYTDSFIDAPVVIDGIRLASVEEITAMKLDVVSREGRKKDFWDIHELMDEYSIEDMFALHKKRHPHTHNRIALKENFSKFELADNDFDPICLHGKYWEFIKLDTIEFVKGLR